MKESREQIEVTYDSGMKFIAETTAGQTITVEPSRCLGGSGKNPGPIDYLLGSLGSCTGIKLLMDLDARQARPVSLRIFVEGKRREGPPAVFENIHVTFHLAGKLDGEVVGKAVERTMTHACPVAVMLGQACNLTWDYRIAS